MVTPQQQVGANGRFTDARGRIKRRARAIFVRWQCDLSHWWESGCSRGRGAPPQAHRFQISLRSGCTAMLAGLRLDPDAAGARSIQIGRGERPNLDPYSVNHQGMAAAERAAGRGGTRHEGTRRSSLWVCTDEKCGLLWRPDLGEDQRVLTVACALRTCSRKRRSGISPSFGRRSLVRGGRTSRCRRARLSQLLMGTPTPIMSDKAPYEKPESCEGRR
jgi:hypothetical protein